MTDGIKPGDMVRFTATFAKLYPRSPYHGVTVKAHEVDGGMFTWKEGNATMIGHLRHVEEVDDEVTNDR